MEQQFAYSALMMEQFVIHTTAATAREKSVHILEHVLSDPQVHSLDRVLQTQIKNPLFIVRVSNRPFNSMHPLLRTS
ncbi:hypothetical protein D3C76_1802310 [compost metagenome]